MGRVPALIWTAFVTTGRAALSIAARLGPKFVGKARDGFLRAGASSRNHRMDLLRVVTGDSKIVLADIAKGLGTQATIEGVLSALDEYVASVTAEMAIAPGEGVDGFLNALGRATNEDTADDILNRVVGDWTELEGLDVACGISVIIGALLNRRMRYANNMKLENVPNIISYKQMKIIGLKDPSRASVVIGKVRASASAVVQNPLTYVYTAYAANGVIKERYGVEDTIVDKGDRFLSEIGNSIESAVGFNPEPLAEGPRTVQRIATNVTRTVARSGKSPERKTTNLLVSNRVFVKDGVDALLESVRNRLDYDGVVEII